MTRYYRPDDVDWPIYSRNVNEPHVRYTTPVRVSGRGWPVIPIVVHKGDRLGHPTCTSCFIRTERASEQRRYNLAALSCFDLPDCSNLYWLRGSDENMARWVANQMEKPNEEK